MRAYIAAIFASLAVVCQASCPPRESSQPAAEKALLDWATSAVNAFFPDHDGWEKGFDESFSRDVFASLNNQTYDFVGFRAAYSEFKPQLDEAFDGTHVHGFYTNVGVPDAVGKGGIVTLTGWEGGFLGGNRSDVINATNGAWAHVQEQQDCSLKIIEWRDSTNLG